MRTLFAAFSLTLTLAGTARTNDLCLAPHPDQGDLNVVCDGGNGPNAWIGYSTQATPCANVTPEYPCGPFGSWTISASDTDPFQNSGSLPAGSTLFLWYLCSGGSGGLAAAAFDLVGSLSVSQFAPRAGFLNGGSDTSLLIVAASCPSGPIVAGDIHVQTTTTVASSTWSSVKALYRID